MGDGQVSTLTTVLSCASVDRQGPVLQFGQRSSLLRRAVLGVAGILAQEILKPDVFFYNAGLPENIPNLYFGGPDGKVSPQRPPWQYGFKQTWRALHPASFHCRPTWVGCWPGNSCYSTGWRCAAGRTFATTIRWMRTRFLRATKSQTKRWDTQVSPLFPMHLVCP